MFLVVNDTKKLFKVIDNETKDILIETEDYEKASKMYDNYNNYIGTNFAADIIISDLKH